jgi:hypothetical protein
LDYQTQFDNVKGGGADINAQGGLYGNALQAASYGGDEKVVQMLLDAGGEVNTQGGRFGNALQAASVGGDEKEVQLLLDTWAEVNAQGELYGNAVVRILQGVGRMLMLNENTIVIRCRRHQVRDMRIWCRR